MIGGDEILDDQGIRNIRYVDAASLVGGIIPLDDIIFDDRGTSPSQVDAASKRNRTRIVGDHIVCNCRRGSKDADAASLFGSSQNLSAILQRESIENGVASFS